MSFPNILDIVWLFCIFLGGYFCGYFWSLKNKILSIFSGIVGGLFSFFFAAEYMFIGFIGVLIFIISLIVGDYFGNRAVKK